MSLSVPQSAVDRLIQAFLLLGLQRSRPLTHVQARCSPARVDLANFLCRRNTSADTSDMSGKQKARIELFWLNL